LLIRPKFSLLDGGLRLTPIPLHTPSREEPLTQPAWRERAVEGNRYSNYPRPISRQVSSTRHVDLDDDDEREIDKGGRRDRERHWDRDRDARKKEKEILKMEEEGGTSPGMSRSPSQFNGPPIPERSASPSTRGWGAGPAPARGPSIKLTAASSSTTASRSPASTSTGKPRMGSVSPGSYPTSSTASFSEAERTRKQQEFAESQLEQFRRTQEKIETERQLKLKSAGSSRSLSRVALPARNRGSNQNLSRPVRGPVHD
jgi:hypothetical protein